MKVDQFDQEVLLETSRPVHTTKGRRRHSEGTDKAIGKIKRKPENLDIR